MYTPAFSSVDEESTVRAMVADVGSGWLVTTSEHGYPVATLLPVLWRGSVILAHMAKANPQWRGIVDGTPCLVIVGGPEAYVSPSWYPSKGEHGRVVPTWNYLAVHLSGTISVSDDREWLRGVVGDLTDHHEKGRVGAWQLTDAPADFVDAQLRAIVGLEVRIERVEAKAKLSQNRPDADQLGVMDALRAGSDPDGRAIAEAMQRVRSDRSDA